jgi:serine/threonine protein kinase
MTLWYRAPEIMFGEDQYDMAIDVWSIGTILGELLTRKALFQGNDTIEVLYKIMQLIGHPEDSWPECKQLTKYQQYNLQRKPLIDRNQVRRVFGPFHDLIMQMLHWSHSQRPKTGQILEELRTLSYQFGA